MVLSEKKVPRNSFEFVGHSYECGTMASRPSLPWLIQEAVNAACGAGVPVESLWSTSMVVDAVDRVCAAISSAQALGHFPERDQICVAACKLSVMFRSVVPLILSNSPAMVWFQHLPHDIAVKLLCLCQDRSASRSSEQNFKEAAQLLYDAICEGNLTGQGASRMKNILSFISIPTDCGAEVVLDPQLPPSEHQALRDTLVTMRTAYPWTYVLEHPQVSWCSSAPYGCRLQSLQAALAKAWVSLPQGPKSAGQRLNFTPQVCFPCGCFACVCLPAS